jgi:hypothetical protein
MTFRDLASLRFQELRYALNLSNIEVMFLVTICDSARVINTVIVIPMTCFQTNAISLKFHIFYLY